jgi:hypothetical protein
MMIAIFLIYILLGMVVVARKLSDRSEEECRKKYWSPLHPVGMLLFWPIFVFVD